MTINLGDDYRLRPMDKLNWVLEQRRIPTGNRAKSDKPKWYQTGNYFQRLVLAPLQLPSWYNTDTKKAPVNRGLFGVGRIKNGNF